MAKNYYTTTEAARLLSVSADTVLKWVRAGKINSYRTPGGHSRIPREAVDFLLPKGKEEEEGNGQEVLNSIHKYCWDFYALEGAIKDDCRECIAYRSRANRCYEMRDLPGQFGPLKLHCETDCVDCEYFKLIQGQATSVLIISPSRKLADILKQQVDTFRLTLKFAFNEYECAVVIEKFRPDYMVVDCSFGTSRTRDLCQQLVNDERIPFSRIILSSRAAKMKDCCDNEVFGWIMKPFTVEQLTELINGAAKQ